MMKKHKDQNSDVEPVDGVAVEPVEGLDGLGVPVGEGGGQADAHKAGKQSLSMKDEIDDFGGNS